MLKIWLKVVTQLFSTFSEIPTDKDMGSHVTRHEHNHVYEKDPSTDTSTGFHVFELHISTVKYGVTTLLVIMFLLAVAYFLWRR